MEEGWEWLGGRKDEKREKRQLGTSWGAQMEQVRTWQSAEWRRRGGVWRDGHEKAGT